MYPTCTEIIGEHSDFSITMGEISLCKIYASH